MTHHSALKTACWAKNAFNRNFSSSFSTSAPSSGRNAYIEKELKSTTQSKCYTSNESLNVCMGLSVKLQPPPETFIVILAFSISLRQEAYYFKHRETQPKLNTK